MAGKKFLILRFFYMMFIIDIAVVLGIVISDTQNNLPMSKMLFFPFVIVLIILMTGLLFIKLKGSFFEKAMLNKKTLLLFLFFYFILLSVLSLISKAVPDNDHYEVYKGALYVTGGRRVIGNILQDVTIISFLCSYLVLQFASISFLVFKSPMYCRFC